MSIPWWSVETKNLHLHIQKDGVSARCFCHVDTEIEIRNKDYRSGIYEVLLGGEYEEGRYTENYATADITKENLIRLRDKINEILEESE